MAHVVASKATAAPLLGVMVQFPSPFRVGAGGEGGRGNTQLPSSPDDPSYMLSAQLMSLIAAGLRTAARSERVGTGWLFVQSNVEDVAVHARALAEAHGMYAVTDAKELAAICYWAGRGVRDEEKVAGAVVNKAAAAEAAEGESIRGAHRRQKLQGILSHRQLPRATGPGWLLANPFGTHLSETEAKLEFDGQHVYRCLLRPRGENQ